MDLGGVLSLGERLQHRRAHPRGLSRGAEKGDEGCRAHGGTPRPRAPEPHRCGASARDDRRDPRPHSVAPRGLEKRNRPLQDVRGGLCLAPLPPPKGALGHPPKLRAEPFQGPPRGAQGPHRRGDRRGSDGGHRARSCGRGGGRVPGPRGVDLNHPHRRAAPRAGLAPSHVDQGDPFPRRSAKHPRAPEPLDRFRVAQALAGLVGGLPGCSAPGPHRGRRGVRVPQGDEGPHPAEHVGAPGEGAPPPRPAPRGPALNPRREGLSQRGEVRALSQLGHAPSYRLARRVVGPLAGPLYRCALVGPLGDVPPRSEGAGENAARHTRALAPLGGLRCELARRGPQKLPGGLCIVPGPPDPLGGREGPCRPWSDPEEVPRAPVPRRDNDPRQVRGGLARDGLRVRVGSPRLPPPHRGVPGRVEAHRVRCRAQGLRVRGGDENLPRFALVGGGEHGFPPKPRAEPAECTGPERAPGDLAAGPTDGGSLRRGACAVKGPAVGGGPGLQRALHVPGAPCVPLRRRPGEALGGGDREGLGAAGQQPREGSHHVPGVGGPAHALPRREGRPCGEGLGGEGLDGPGLARCLVHHEKPPRAETHSPRRGVRREQHPSRGSELVGGEARGRLPGLRRGARTPTLARSVPGGTLPRDVAAEDRPRALSSGRKLARPLGQVTDRGPVWAENVRDARRDEREDRAALRASPLPLRPHRVRDALAGVRSPRCHRLRVRRILGGLWRVASYPLGPPEGLTPARRNHEKHRDPAEHRVPAGLDALIANGCNVHGAKALRGLRRDPRADLARDAREGPEVQPFAGLGPVHERRAHERREALGPRARAVGVLV